MDQPTDRPCLHGGWSRWVGGVVGYLPSIVSLSGDEWPYVPRCLESSKFLWTNQLTNLVSLVGGHSAWPLAAYLFLVDCCFFFGSLPWFGFQWKLCFYVVTYYVQNLLCFFAKSETFIMREIWVESCSGGYDLSVTGLMMGWVPSRSLWWMVPVLGLWLGSVYPPIRAYWMGGGIHLVVSFAIWLIFALGRCWW